MSSVSRFQLDNSLGSAGETLQVSLELIELIFLLLKQPHTYEKQTSGQFKAVYRKAFWDVMKISKPTIASCSKSSSRVTVIERSHAYFFFIMSSIFFILSSASLTSEKNCRLENVLGHQTKESKSLTVTEGFDKFIAVSMDVPGSKLCFL